MPCSTNTGSFSRAPLDSFPPSLFMLKSNPMPSLSMDMHSLFQKPMKAWFAMKSPPQHPPPVQRKQMGHTFFRNSQEKWSDLICLRLLPTKQMDHLPIPSSNMAYITYQEEHKIWMDKGTSTSLWLTQKFPHSWSCPCLPRLLGSLWNLHQCLKIPNWIHHYSKGQATCILFQETHWSSNEIHCDRTRTACNSGNASWVQMYSRWTFEYNLHQSRESYLFKLHYPLHHSLAIDCWGIWSQHCLPSWQMQYHCRHSLSPTKT